MKHAPAQVRYSLKEPPMRLTLLLLSPLLVVLMSNTGCGAAGTDAQAGAPPRVDTIPDHYVTSKGLAEVPAPFTSMLGRWQSTHDPKEVIHFLPGRYITYYGGEQVVEEQMSYHEICPAFCTGETEAAPAYPCFVLEGEYDASCFAVLKQEGDRLELSMLGGAGNTLVYERFVEE